MLQIISGKFFKSNNRHVFDAKGITYSNYSWFQPIKTCVATLEPVDVYKPVSSYVICYKNQIEKKKEYPLVRTGDAEIVQQFQLLCMFGLKSFFNIDRNSVKINCRERPRSSEDYYLPSMFVPRFFKSRIDGKMEEIEAFIKFVDKVIGLPREKYLVVINCLNNFSHAIQFLNYNFDLAYSMLIYSLESLSQSFDAFEPTWEDYFQEIKNKLDIHLLKIDQNIANDIREILLKSHNFRSQQRFIKFLYENLSGDFFIEEAKDINKAIRKSELKRALRNAYTLRSRYTHQLKPIQEHLKFPQIADGDVIHWENEPYLTFRGLVRAAYHVINNFIWNQEYLTSEEYNWRKDLPGILTVELAPQYWVWEHKAFLPQQATQKFSGFLLQLMNVIITGGSLNDLRELLEKFEALIPTANKKYKTSMFALYVLYHNFIVEEGRRPGYKKFIEKHEELFNESCIEMMVTHLFLNRKWPWNVNECVLIYNKWRKIKFSKSALSIPLPLELCLITKIANMHLEKNEIDKYNKWLNYAIFEVAGKINIQKFLEECKSNKVKVDYNLILEHFKSKVDA